MDAFIIILPIIVIFSVLMLWGAIGYWIYRDACIYTNNPIMWTVIVLVFNQSFIGLLLYFLIGRKKDCYKCENCGNMNSKVARYCNNCGKVIEENTLREDKNISKKQKRNFVIIIILVLSFIVISFLGLIFGAVSIFNKQKGVKVEEVKTLNEAFEEDNSSEDEMFLSDFTNSRFNKFTSDGISFFSTDVKTENSIEVKAKKINRKMNMEVDIKDPIKEKLYIDYKGSNMKEANFNINQEITGAMDDISLISNELIEIDLSKYEAGKANIEILLEGKNVSFRLEIK
ncbi:MAG: hypothetical protein ACRCX8_13575 [Sarcina sp.]